MELVVIGSGPAGWLAATACAEAGHRVSLVSPDPTAPWPARYGAWTRELAEIGALATLATHTWPTVGVVCDRRRQVDRGYARVDGAGLLGLLQGRFLKAGGQTVRGRVVGVRAARHHDEASAPTRVELDTGGSLSADLVLDASGVPGRAGGPEVRAWQRAWGEELQLAGGVTPDGLRGMTLMDWTPPSPRWLARWRERPTFLYAMELGEGRVFLEETQLSASDPLSHGELRARLHARRRRLGVLNGASVVDVERCALPMLLAPQAIEPGVVRFGARAGFVHPATGYSLTWSARQSRRLCAALEGVGARRGEAAAAPVRAALVSDPRAELLTRFGAELLLSLDGPASVAFFAAFFALPPSRWSALLDRGSPVGRRIETMSRVYLAAPASIRRRLRHAAWRDRGRVSAALIGRPNLREVSR